MNFVDLNLQNDSENMNPSIVQFSQKQTFIFKALILLL